MAEAICKRCIHHDICDAYTGEETVTFFPYNEDCKHFKNKADVVEVRHATRGLHVGDKYFCSNCGRLVHCACYCEMCGAEMVEVKSV